MMELEKDMLAAGNPEFELNQIERQIKNEENDAPITYGFGQFLTILCCK